MSAAACGMTCVTASVVRASLCRFVCLARVPAVLSDCILVGLPGLVLRGLVRSCGFGFPDGAVGSQD